MLSRSPGHSGRRPDAFTLVEILVVVAITTICAVILLPTFGRARENARRSSCVSNLRQIGLGILQYAQDYDGRLPRNDSGKADVGTWVETTTPYLKSWQSLLCPSDTSPYVLKGSGGRRTSYTINQVYYQDPKQALFEANTPGIAPAMLVAIEDVSGTIAAGDGGDFYQVCPRANHDSINMAPDDTPPWIGDGGKYGVFIGRHFEGANWLFVDGHVKWMRMETVASASDASTGQLELLTRTLD